MKSRYRYLFLTLISILLFSCVSAQKTERQNLGGIEIDSDKLMADLKFLSSDDLKGRKTGTPESGVAREFIVKRFKESGLSSFESGFVLPFSFETRSEKKYEGANVIGFIRGKSKPGKYIVVSAHYDHVGVNGGEIFNGADDNASGTAALFQIAKHFSKIPPQHSLIFAAWDAEEIGLQGAKHFLEKPPVSIQDLILNINMDMVARSDKNELYVAGTYHYPAYKPIIAALVDKVPVRLLFGHDRPEDRSNDWTSQSDHAAFHKMKIPFVYFGVEDHKDYHKPTDDFENVDPEFYKNAVETITKAIVSLDLGIK